MSPERGTPGRPLDLLSEAVLLCDREGRVVWRNVALDELLAAEPEDDRLALDIGRFARGLAEAGGDGTGAAGHGIAEMAVRTAGGRYRLRGIWVREGVFDAGAVGFVAVVRHRRQLPAPTVLRERFGLTRRQAQVALLLAERWTNREIADALTISPHTALRHTERVLLKLDLHSRRDVRNALLSAV